jgi:uncharacterized membrane protein YgcG
MWGDTAVVIFLLVLVTGCSAAILGYLFLKLKERKRRKEHEDWLRRQLFLSSPPRVPRIRPGTGIHRPAPPPPPPPPARIIKEGRSVSSVEEDGGLTASDLAALALLAESIGHSGSSVEEPERVERGGEFGGGGASGSWDSSDCSSSSSSDSSSSSSGGGE